MSEVNLTVVEVDYDVEYPTEEETQSFILDASEILGYASEFHGENLSEESVRLMQKAVEYLNRAYESIESDLE